MKYFRNPADRLPTAVIVLIFVADLIVFFSASSLWVFVVWFGLMIWPKSCICAWNHHHQHCPTFKHRWMNRLMELVYAAHTGITTNAWVLHHNLGHHVNYLDQTRDESRWKRKDGTTMGCSEYTLYLAVTGYAKAMMVGFKYPKYLKSFFGMGLTVLALLGLALYYNWHAALFLFILPMLIGYVVTCWATYYHHADLDTDNHLEASYNITHKWYNILTGNLGYHTAHHMKQSLHWSKLPEFHRRIESKIPKHLYREPCFPFGYFPAN